MEDLQNKDKSIKVIWNTIVSVFGIDYFRIVDFWDADNFALGILRGDKLIYVSTWDMNNESSAEILCYVEFERENGNNDIPYTLIKKIQKISVNELIKEICVFLKQDKQ